jgi:hypothetical protein
MENDVRVDNNSRGGRVPSYVVDDSGGTTRGADGVGGEGVDSGFWESHSNNGFQGPRMGKDTRCGGQGG